MTTSPIGATAAGFVLRSHWGAEVDLTAVTARGAAVLVFFPGAFTPVCAQELAELRDHHALFDAADATVLGISVDSVATLRAFAEQETLPFDLLADFWPHGEVARRYAAFDEATGIATRTTVVVNISGQLHARFAAEAGEARELADYREALNSL